MANQFYTQGQSPTDIVESVLLHPTPFSLTYPKECFMVAVFNNRIDLFLGEIIYRSIQPIGNGNFKTLYYFEKPQKEIDLLEWYSNGLDWVMGLMESLPAGKCFIWRVGEDKGTVFQ